MCCTPITEEYTWCGSPLNSPDSVSTQNFVAQRLAAMPCYGAALLALCAGALQSLALAPFNYWPAAIFGLGIFALLLPNASRRHIAFVSTSFGLGLFGAGVSWVYVSIHQFGGAAAWFAVLLTFAFVAFLALVFALPFVACARLFCFKNLSLILTFPACYILGEWLRSWLFTGFPWLYVGYGHGQTALAGWAPIVGVLGLGYFACLSAVTLAYWGLATKPSIKLITVTLAVATVWFSGMYLRDVPWTRVDTEQPIQVAIVQPNIPQEIKWHPDYARPTLDKLQTMSKPLWQYDWIIWPEAAVPIPYHRALSFLDEINTKAYETQTGLITGIIYDDQTRPRFYNSIAGFGDAMGIYHKRRLVR